MVLICGIRSRAGYASAKAPASPQKYHQKLDKSKWPRHDFIQFWSHYCDLISIHFGFRRVYFHCVDELNLLVVVVEGEELGSLLLEGVSVGLSVEGEVEGSWVIIPQSSD